jgi:CheY-like chemotaxis protein
LLELQNGRIEVQSELNKGSRFVLRLGLSTASVAMNSKPITEAFPNIYTSNELRGIKILLVEDNWLNHILAKKFLQKWKVEVDYAENGLKAIEKVKSRTLNDFYDLILMDLQMPEMDGFQATQLIRLIPQQIYREIPIIAMTAYSWADIADKATSSGITDFIMKPFHPKELFQKINKYTVTKTPEVEIYEIGLPQIDIDNLKELADGDVEYEKEMRDLYIKFLIEFKAKFRNLVIERQLVQLQAFAHKSKPAIVFLNLIGIQSTLEESLSLVSMDGVSTDALEKITIKAEQICDEYLAQLSQLV